MTEFILKIDLSAHRHQENPVAQRALVQQLLQQAAQQIGSGYVDRRVSSGEVDADHHSVVHAQGDIVYSAAAFQEKTIIGTWKFIEPERKQPT